MMKFRARFAVASTLKLGVVLSAVVLSSCAAGYELRVDAAPTTSSRFENVALVPDVNGTAAATAVLHALKRHHDIEEGDDWHLTTTLAVRLADIGTATDHLARDGSWLETPRVRGARRGTWLHVLSISAVRATGEEPRVVIVSARNDEDKTSDALLRVLADAAAKALVEGAVITNQE